MDPSRPLEGFRILDFTWVRAGPWATRWLAVLGAEVIKIQWPGNLGVRARSSADATKPGDLEPEPNSNGGFCDGNPAKLGVSLNVRTPQGMELVKQLIGISDAVIENFSAGVMGRWGIPYEEMRKIRPDIVYVSMAGLGHFGPWVDYTTMGPSAQSLGGLQFISGLPDQAPSGWGYSYMDDVGGIYGAMSMVTALRHRQATGQGQYVDLSQMSVGPTIVGPAFIDRTINDRPARREGYPPGNRAAWPKAPLAPNYRDGPAVPHNAYRTKPGGYNDWCTIACLTDAEWKALVGVMGVPAWADDPGLDTLRGRLARQTEIDEGIQEWAIGLDKYELTEKCQAAGVRAMAVQSSENRVEHDPQLKSRRMHTEIDHPLLGSKKQQNAPFTISGAHPEVAMPAPLIGEHTRQVMEGLLGMDLGEVRDGFDEGIFWPEGTGKYPHIEEALL